MIYILGATGAAVALILAYFIAGNMVADWHYGNAEILRRNVRACRRVAGGLR